MTAPAHNTPTRALNSYKDQRVFVVGLGRTGLATANALQAGGADVRCWDDNGAARSKAEELGFTLTDPATSPDLTSAAALILSPGIPFTHPTPHLAVLAAQSANVPVLGDVELLFRAEPQARFVGITGTNGKSTTTALLGHILNSAGLNVAIGGNLGFAALSLPKADIYVLEMSSYQLDLTPSAMFDIAVLLNITPDHLDRHGGMDGYIAAKERILRLRTPEGLAVIGTGTPPSARIADQFPQRLCTIDATTEPTASLIKSGASPALAGDHNKENAAAAFAVARELGLDDIEILSAIRSFPGLAHRQERIATLDGLTYINDSKATNAEAAATALSAYHGIYWIAGGKGKDGGYDALAPYLSNVRQAFLIGDAAEAIESWISGRVPVQQSGTLAQAIEDATQAARTDPAPGPILLSPACASFDQFSNFEARGDVFRSLVLGLPAQDRTVHSTREAA